MRDPLAFLLTMRTYGTWLHGDERGSVDRDHNLYGTPYLETDGARLSRETRTMRFAPMIFDLDMRRIVEASLDDTSQYHNWMLIERAARSNHVHVVIGFAGINPNRMLQRLKARATRALREARCVTPEQPVWVDGPGSRKYLWTESDIADAATYVRECQDEPR